MQTLTALFDHYDDARDAVMALEAAGIPSENISLIANEVGMREAQLEAGAAAAEGAGAGISIGAVVGGAGGLLAGLGALAIPGIGPVIAGGWLAATLVGAVAGAAVGGAAGGLIGALMDAGVAEDEAHVYAEGVRRGGTLVTARVDDAQVSMARDILDEARTVDIESRRAAFEEEGWEQFDPEAPPHTPKEIRDYAGLYGSGRGIY